MANAKEELVEQIEKIRKKMDQCIEQREEYRKIYRYSVELDQLILTRRRCRYGGACFLFVQKTPQGSFAGFNLHNFFEKCLAIFLRMY